MVVEGVLFYCRIVKHDSPPHSGHAPDSWTTAFLPVRSLVVPVQFPECLAGLESAEPRFRKVERSVQVQRQEDEEVKSDTFSERRTEEEEEEEDEEEEEQTSVDSVNDDCLVSCPDDSTTAPLAPSALQAGPPTQNGPPWKS